LGERHEEHGELVLRILQRQPAVGRARLQLVVQQRLQKLRQAELKHVQARIRVDQVVGDLCQGATLRRCRPPQRGEDLLQGRQTQHGLEIVG